MEGDYLVPSISLAAPDDAHSLVVSHWTRTPAQQGVFLFDQGITREDQAIGPPAVPRNCATEALFKPHSLSPLLVAKLHL